MTHPTDDAGDAGDASGGNARSEALTLIAHRGFAHTYPDNTLAAMRGAARDGADMIEIDVQLCADGEVCVFHDPRLDETTDREGVVTETSCDTVLGAEVLQSGETIPTLDALMEVIPPAVGVNVELKTAGRLGDAGHEDGSNERAARWTPLVERTLDVLAGHDNPVLLSSFHTPALAAVRGIDPTVPLAPLFADATERAFTAARHYDCVAIHPSLRCTDRALVARAHSVGMAVNPYTVARPAQTARLRWLGVDGVIADSAGVLDP